MEDWIVEIISRLGYVGIGFLMLLENVFPPLPSEFIMPLAGFAASQGRINLVGSIAAGVVGSWLGTLPWYFIGVKWGRTRSLEFLSKYSRWTRITRQDLEKAEHWFLSHGRPSLLFGRLIPGIRTVISLPAGITRVPFFEYTIYTLIGTLFWNSFLGGAGYILGSQYHLVERFVGPISLIILGAIALFLLLRSLFRTRSS